MSMSSGTPSGVAPYRLVVESEPSSNALLRLLEPFVIHDVLPRSVRSEHECGVVSMVIAFSATSDLAARLLARMEAMVTVRAAALVPCDMPMNAPTSASTSASACAPISAAA
ncbi:hypothetical protein [Aquabacter sediminis]|uniref:hypothetical protein n=1 Tax=Aquabacter sediminis TaxID=3029197 RepID=UPI00237E640B|nr:hypothetical protein [Aquabacter sp. P-9]MDE1568779.1 hypothetical protein [Aquabacter sp. P-9]